MRVRYACANCGKTTWAENRPRWSGLSGGLCADCAAIPDRIEKALAKIGLEFDWWDMIPQGDGWLGLAIAVRRVKR